MVPDVYVDRWIEWKEGSQVLGEGQRLHKSLCSLPLVVLLELLA